MYDSQLNILNWKSDVHVELITGNYRIEQAGLSWATLEINSWSVLLSYCPFYIFPPFLFSFFSFFLFPFFPLFFFSSFPPFLKSSRHPIGFPLSQKIGCRVLVLLVLLVLYS